MRGLRVRGLGVRRGDRDVVYGVDFDAPRGAVTALLGPNGAGKTTVLRALLGLEPSTGSLRLDSTDLRELGPLERARRVAWVPQRAAFAVDLTAEEIVMQGRFAWRKWLARPSPADDLAVLRALEDANAASLAGRRFRTLSGGEQQRVLLARALATGATTLLLDEPTTSLDIGGTLRLFERIRDLARRDWCILAVLHGLSEVRAHADHAVLLHGGRRVADGTPNDVVTDRWLADVYGVRVHEGRAPTFSLVGAG